MIINTYECGSMLKLVDRLVSKTNDLGRVSSSLTTPTNIKSFVAQTVTLGAVCYNAQQKSAVNTRD